MNYSQKFGETDKYIRKKKCLKCGGLEWTDAGNLRLLGKIIKSYECKSCGARGT